MKEDYYFNFTIKREDEAAFPTFSSVAEARAYFSERYGERYNFGESEDLGEPIGRIYFDDVDGQPVQIAEDGSVHVVY